MSWYTRGEWLKTPYADSSARDPDGDIRAILAKRDVTDIQTTQTTGPNGRPAYVLRFRLGSKVYRIGMETLHAQQVSAEHLLKQAKRAVYHLLKSVLEFATVFAPVEQVLFAFVESAAGPTMYEIAKPQLDRLESPNFGGVPALPQKG